MKRPSISAVEDALYEERALVRMLAMRRTLFVEPADLVPVVHAAAARAVARRERTRLEGFLRDGGIAADARPWLRAVEKATVAALAERGVATAAELSGDVPELKEQLHVGVGKKWGGTVSICGRVLVLLAAEGRIVRGRPRGSWISTQYRWTPAEEWLGAPIPDIPTEVARAELARRWLRAFGPGTVADLRWWTGWTLGEVRKTLGEVKPAEVELEEGIGLVLADDIDRVRAPKPWVALLPALDPTVMGWTERGWFLSDHRSELFDRSGNAGPTVWWNGHVVGGWAQRKDGEIAYRLLEDVGREAIAGVADAAAHLETLVGDVRFTPRFRTPLERELSS
jgi:hypothetical protein